MPDICLCTGGDCPLKESCYRFTAIPFGLQMYMKPPYNFETNNCDYHWPDSEEKRLNLTRPKK